MSLSKPTRREALARLAPLSATVAVAIAPSARGAEGAPFTAPATNPNPTKPAAVGGQLAKALVVDDPLAFVFVSEGESMSIEPKGGGPALMQVQFTRGRSAIDAEDPSKIVVYPYPFLWLTKNPTPIPGLPNFVRRVRLRDGKIYVEIVLGRWSNLFEEACKAHWMRRNADLLARERKARGIEGLEVVVKRPPVIELFIALQDRVTGLTLAHEQQNVLRGPDELTYLFAFEPAAYDAFLRAEREGDLVIQPIWRARMRDYKLGTLRVDATINLQQTIEQKLASEGLQVDGPIDQLTYDQLTREILAEMKTTIAADHPDVLPLLKTNLLLMEGVLKPDGWMTWHDFCTARGPEADQILAEYLAPHGLTLLKNKVTKDDQTTTSGHQKTTRGGGGFGFSLPYSGFNKSSEEENRDINLTTKATGVEFQEGETKHTFTPHRIKRYRMAEGNEDRGVHQTLVIQIGGQNAVHFFKDTAVPSTLDASVIVPSLVCTIDVANNLVKLVENKRRLIAERETHVEKVHRELRDARSPEAIGIEHSLAALRPVSVALPTNVDTIVGEFPESVREENIRAILGMAKAVWGHNPQGGFEAATEGHMNDSDNIPGYPNRRARSAAAKQQVANNVAAVKNHAAALNNVIHEIETARDSIEASLKTISELDLQIAKLDDQIVAAAKR